MQPDDLKLQRVLSTPGQLREYEKKLGPYVTNLGEAIPADWARTKYAADIVRTKHARFLTVHLGALDHVQHDSAPFSPEALAALEEIDKMVGMLKDAMKAETGDAATCIVSDHGFTRVDHVLSLRVAFADAGLITPNTQRASSRAAAVTAWKAQTWESAGSAMVVLKDPNDGATREAVERLLRRLASNPEHGIRAVLDRKEIAALGGAPNAEFVVDMQPNFLIESAMTGPLVRERKPGGAHGYSPTQPEMRASFLIAGPGVREGIDVGDIDMRSIAPTIAAYLGLAFSTAELPALGIFARR
jgi:predicted AlkP superfamily pyrophosphatase or phosphodiesterase